MVTRTRTINFLPEIFQTRTNQLFLNATLDQLVQQPDFKKVQGFIGSKFGYGVKGTDTYLAEPDNIRTNYQLEPAVIFQNPDTSQVQDLITYPGIVDAIKTESGIEVSDNKLFNNQFYCWDSFVDLDKITNYGQYYWIPSGPESVNISTDKLLLNANLTVISNPNTYDFSISNTGATLTGNPEITLVRGGTYNFVVDQAVPFYIQTMPGLSGVDPTQTNVSTRDIYGLTNNGIPKSTITFTVPMSDAQDSLKYLPGITVDLVTTLNFNDINGQYASEITIDGISNLQGKTLLFYGQTPSAISPVDASTINDNLYRISYVGSATNQVILLTPVTPIPTETRIDVSSGKEYIGKQFVKNSQAEIISIPLITAPLNTLYYVDGSNSKKFGIIKIVDDVFSGKLNINDILGRATYTASNGIVFTNGLRVTFTGNVFPESYLNDSYYVEGVGDSINLIPSKNQTIVEPFGEYIDQPYDSDFYGTNTFDNSNDLPNLPDYITINRNSRDRNAWSRGNCWFHADVLKIVVANNSISPKASAALAGTTNRAKRPIIEFYPNLRLFAHGINGKDTVDYFDNTTPNALSTVNGQTVYHPDGPTSGLFEGARIVFAADNNLQVRNKIYTCHLATVNHKQIITLSEAYDGNIQYLDSVHVARGDANGGYSFYFDGNIWINAQEKNTVNQFPLFDLFDGNGNSLSDQEYYSGSDFKGCTLFQYQVGSGPVDSVLNLPISYSGVGNLNDIVFENTLNTQTFNYVLNNTSVNDPVNNSYVHSYDINNNLVRKIGWVTAAENSFQYQIFNYIYDTTTMVNGPIFVADVMVKDSETTVWPTVIVYVDNIIVSNSSYTVTHTSNTTTVTINTSIANGTHVDIKLYSDQVSKLGYFEIPSNLDHNPFNFSITAITSGDIKNHYSSIVSNLGSNISGAVFGSNNYRDLGPLTITYGTKIIQNSSSLAVAAAFIRNQNGKFFDSLIFNSNEYIKFKSTLVHTVDQQNYSPYSSPASMLDEVLGIMTSVKSPENPFFWSDMIPNQNPSVSNSYTFRIGLSQALFPLSRVYDYTAANYYGVLVYVNRVIDGLPVQTQLTKDIDYIIVDNYLEIVLALEDHDNVLINEYYETYGSYIPNTPTKLGLYPKFVPAVVLDDTYTQPTYFIIGHDGSYNKLYGDYNNGLLQDFRDKVLYEFELRVYNNMKVNTTFTIQPDMLRPGYFRDTGYTYDEYMSIYSTNFLNWVGLNRVNYVTQNYESTNDRTYNYSNAVTSLNTGSFTSGNWRGIFLNLYDTTNPHTRPWEMLGFQIKPNWWDSRYGTAPYTSDNLLLWTDLSNGFVYNNGNSYIDTTHARPGLLNIIPVDENGNLLSPFRINGLITRYKVTEFSNDWKVGDVGPVEYSYLKSSSYPFDLMRIYALVRPGDFFCLGLDLDVYNYNTEFNQFLVYNRYRTPVGKIQFYGGGSGLSRDQIDNYAQHSYIDWVVDYLQQFGVNGTTEVYNVLTNLDIRLAYRMAGFSDHSQLQFFIEKGSPNSTTSSLLIPDDSYNIVLYQNEPTNIIVYSSVIVQKTLSGFKVFGNSQNKAYFLSYAPYYNNLVNPISVGPTTVKIPVDFTTNIVTTAYGYEFGSIQLLCEFLKGYGVYLESQGMQFNDIENNVAINWEQMISEIIYWYNSGWQVGSTINVNPNANVMTIDSGSSVVQPLTDYKNNFILNQNLVQMPLETLAISRIDTEFTVSSLSQSDAISYFRSSLSSTEHVIVFDNVTVFNDVIFNLLTGLRQQRIYLRGTKSNNWNGTLYAPGFIINQDNAVAWEPNKQYYKGDTVLYKNSYYMANIDVIIPSDTFNSSDWIKTQYQKIHKGLLANPNTRASESELYYNTYSSNLQNDADLLSYSLIGYRPKSYLSDINLTDPSQVNLYQSMIGLKGTENALNLMQNIDLNSIEFSYNMYENWLIQTNEFGGLLNQNFIEFTLDGGLLTGNPAIASVIIDTPVTASQQEVPLYKLINYGRLVNNTSILPLTTTQTVTGVPSAGYVNLTDTTVVSYNLSQLQNDTIYNLYGDDYVYIADISGTWGIYCAIPITGVTISSVINNLNGTATVKFNKNPKLYVGSIIGILYYDSRIDGYYSIVAVLNDLTYVITVTLSNSITQITNASASFVVNLESVRISDPTQLINLSIPYEYSNNLVWVDKSETNNWAVLQKSLNYTKQNFLGSISGNTTYGDSVNYVPKVGYVVGDSGAGKVYVYKQTDNGFILRNTIEKMAPFGKVIARNDEFMVITQPDSALSYIYIYRIVQMPEVEALVEEQTISYAINSEMGNSVALSGDGQFIFIGIDGYKASQNLDAWVLPPSALIFKRQPDFTYLPAQDQNSGLFVNLYEATLPDKKYFKVNGDQTQSIEPGKRVTFFQYSQYKTSVLRTFGYIPQAYTKFGVAPTGGSGSGVKFDVTLNQTQYSVAISAGYLGTNYHVNDTLTIYGTSLDGGSPVNDITIQVLTVNNTGGITSAIITSGLANGYNLNGSNDSQSVVFNRGTPSSANNYLQQYRKYYVILTGTIPIGTHICFDPTLDSVDYVLTNNNTVYGKIFTGVSATNLVSIGGTGTVTFDVDVNGTTYLSVTPDFGNAGSGYIIGDTLKISGSSLNGLPNTNDIIVTVSSVDGNGAITGVTFTGTGSSNNNEQTTVYFDTSDLKYVLYGELFVLLDSNGPPVSNYTLTGNTVPIYTYTNMLPTYVTTITSTYDSNSNVTTFQTVEYIGYSITSVNTYVKTVSNVFVQTGNLTFSTYYSVGNYYSLGQVATTSYAKTLATNHDGSKLFIGSPTADYNGDGTIANIGKVFVYTRLSETWEVEYDVKDASNGAKTFYTLVLPWNPDPSSTITINGVALKSNQYFLLNLSNSCFLLIGPDVKAGDIITLSSPEFVLDTELVSYDSFAQLRQGQQFGASLSCNTTGSELLVGCPYDVTLPGQEGAVYRFTNEGKKFGTITALIAANNVLGATYILLNGYRVNIPTGDAYDIANAINNASIMNVIAYVYDSPTGENLLRIRLIDNTLFGGDDQLNIAVFNGNFLYELGISPYIKTQVIREPHPQTSGMFGYKVQFNEANSFVVTAPRSSRYLNTTFDLIDTTNSHNNTVFDNNLTIFEDSFPYAGAAYVYDYVKPYKESLLNTGQFVYGQSVNDTIIDYGPTPEYGLSVAFSNNTIMVGSPNFKSNVQTTTLTFTGDGTTKSFAITSGLSIFQITVKVDGIPMKATSNTTYYVSDGVKINYLITAGLHPNDVLVTVNDVQLVPSTDYTTSGPQLIFTSAPATDSSIAITELSTNTFRLSGSNIIFYTAPKANSVITVIQNVSKINTGYAAENGSVIIYENVSGITNWHTYREPCEIVDVSKINKVELYNNIDNTNLDSLDYFDPLNGKLLGAVRENLDYISSSDPAGYNSGTYSIGKNTWGDNHVGKIWYNTYTSRYLDYHQDDLAYNSSYWGYLFPGSEVTVYTWVASSVDPSMYTGPGTVYDIEKYAVAYTTTSSEQLNATYYFWVRNTNVLYKDKTLTDTVLENYIKDPQNSGIAYFAPLTSNTFAIYNSRDNINELNTNIHIGFSSGSGSSTSHAKYELIRSNFEDDFLPGFIDKNLGITSPTGLYSVLLDSFAGCDEAGQIVPNFRLPKYLQIGVNVRPRQGMFIDRLAALKNYLLFANNVLIQYPIADYSTPSMLYMSGEYFNTSDYWSTVYWWQTGYDNNTKTSLEVNIYSDLLRLSPPEGYIVGVRKNNKGKREVYSYTNGTWVRIGLQDGTIQFSSKLWDYTNNLIGFGNSFFDTTPYGYFPSTETRYIIRALNEQIYVNELLKYRNESLILIFEYIQSENIAGHNYLPWLNKSSFIDIDYTVRSLIQTPNYRPDNDTLISGHVDEIKPYHTVVRNIEYKYTVNDNTETYSTDFDLPPLYNSVTNKFTSPNLVYTNNLSGNGNYLPSDPIWQNDNYAVWINNHGLSLVDAPNTVIGLLKNYIVKTDTSFYINNARGLPVEGIIQIDNELMSYNTIDANTGKISGVIRGINQTQITTHFPGASIIMDLPAVVVIDSGRGYIDPPTVVAVIDTTLYPVPVVPAILEPIMSGDMVVGVHVIDPGKNYPVAPEIIISSSYEVSFDSDQINYINSTIIIPSTYLMTGDLIRATSNNSTQTTIIDGYYYIYVVAQLDGQEIIEISLHKSFRDSLVGHGRLEITPPTSTVKYTFGLTAQAIPQTGNTVVRGLGPKMRFDRTSYEPKLVTWQPSAFYSSPYIGIAAEASQTAELSYGIALNTTPESGTVNPSGGTGATFTIYNILFGGTYDATIVNGGSGYHVNDVITIPGNTLNGATPANDCVLTVTGILSNYIRQNQDTTTGSGTGALFNISYSATTTSGPAYQVTIGVNGSYGTNYHIGDTITFSGIRFNGTSPANDLTITVNNVASNGAIAPTSGFTYTGTPVSAGPINKITPSGKPIDAGVASATGVLLPITNSVADSNNNTVVTFNYNVSGLNPAQIEGLPIYFYQSNLYYTYDDTTNNGAKLEIYRPRFGVGTVRNEYSVKIINPGSIYNDTSIITISGTHLGGTTPANDAIIIITTGYLSGSYPIITAKADGISVNDYNIYYGKPIDNTTVQVYIDGAMKKPLPYSQFVYTTYSNSPTPSYGYIPQPIYSGESYVYDTNSYVVHNGVVYRCIASNNDAIFDSNKWVVVNEDDLNLNALDRIVAYYNPTSAMLPKDIRQLVAGASYPNNVYYGNSFSPEDTYPLDTILKGQQFFPRDSNIISLIFTGSNYVGVSENTQHSSLIYSSDGINYNNNSISSQPLAVTSICYYDPYQQYIVTTTADATPILISYDLTNWTTVGSNINLFGEANYDETPLDISTVSCPPGALNCITIAQGYYYAAGASIISSPDGIVWTTIASFSNPSTLIYGIQNVITSTFDGFIAVGGETVVLSGAGTSAPVVSNASVVYSSTDGVTWNLLTPYFSTHTLYTVCASPSLIVVAGDATTIYNSVNGSNWAPSSVPAGLNVKLKASIYALGKFIIVGDNATILTSSLGTSFSKVPVNVSYNFNTITFDGTYFYIGADEGHIYRSSDTIAWLDINSIGQPSNEVDPLEKLPYTTVKGTDFLFGYGPEELVPGLMFDSVTIHVNTTPGSYWDDSSVLLQAEGGSIIGYTGFNMISNIYTPDSNHKVSFAGVVKNPSALSVYIVDSSLLGTRIYENVTTSKNTTSYSVNWITKTITLSQALQSGHSLMVEVYEIGNGRQYARGTTDNIPLQTNIDTGFTDILINHAYVPVVNDPAINVYNEPVCYHNGTLLTYGVDYVVTYDQNDFNYTIIRFNKAYVQGVDYISFALLQTSVNPFNAQEYQYSISQTQVFHGTATQTFTPNNPLPKDPTSDSIVELNGLRLLVNVDYSVSYSVGVATFTMLTNTIDTNDIVAITTFNETDRLLLETSYMTWGSSTSFQVAQPIDLSANPFANPYYYTDGSRTYVTINGKRVSPSLCSFQTGNNKLNIGTTISSGDIVEVTAFVSGATPNQTNYSIEIDKSSSMNIYRTNDNEITWLTQPLNLTDDVVHLNDVTRVIDNISNASNFVEINGEKIRFTSSNLHDNTLVGLTRGVLGTGIVETHPKYSSAIGINNTVKLASQFYNKSWNSKNIDANKGDPLQLSNTAAANFLNM